MANGSEDGKSTSGAGGEGRVKEAKSLIPSLYYDLIARVIPGCALILLWAPHAFSELLDKSSSAALVLLLVLGYLIGMLLTAISIVWSTPVLILAAFPCTRSALVLKESRLLKALVELGTRNDAIAIRNPEAGVTLAKMQAETMLGKNLLTAYLATLFSQCLGLTIPALLCALGPTARMAILLLLALSAVFRSVVYMGRQIGFANALSI